MVPGPGTRNSIMGESYLLGEPQTLEELGGSRKRPRQDSSPIESSKRVPKDRLTFVPGTFRPVVILDEGDCSYPVVPRLVGQAGAGITPWLLKMIGEIQPWESPVQRAPTRNLDMHRGFLVELTPQGGPLASHLVILQVCPTPGKRVHCGRVLTYLRSTCKRPSSTQIVPSGISGSLPRGNTQCGQIEDTIHICRESTDQQACQPR